MRKVIIITEKEFEDKKARFEKQLTELKNELEKTQEENKSLKGQRAYLLEKIRKLEE